jgi:hypothetical protein
MRLQALAIPNNIVLLAPWVGFTEKQQERAMLLSSRLRSDLPQGHLLSGLDLMAVAARTDRDDVLFEVIGVEKPLALVHMTWRKETDPRWPQTRLFRNWQQWIEEAMLPDHKDFTNVE